VSQQPGIGPQRIRASGVVDSNGVGIITFDFTGYLTGRRGAITRMIAGVAIPAGELANIASDAFQRVVAGGWGSSDSGQPWTIIANPEAGPGAFLVNGTEGHIDTSSVAGLFHIAMMGLSVQDATILGTIGLPVLGTASVFGHNARVVDTNNYVGAHTTGNVSPFTIRLDKRVAGVDTTLIQTTKALVMPCKCRFTLDGNTLSGKWWNTTDPEPDAYDISTGLNVPAPIAGGVGFQSFTTGTVPHRTLDDLLVSSATPSSPHWDAYIGDISNPSNIVDSSQGVALLRWVPALVNGQPISQGDVLSIVALEGTPGTQLVASCYLVTEPV
jgi:hypothetical protein